MVLEFLHAALLYQATNARNVNVLAVLKQYLVLVKKEQWGDFVLSYQVSADVHVHLTIYSYIYIRALLAVCIIMS